MDRLTYAEILSSSLVGSGASIAETSRLLNLDKRSCHRLFSKGKVRFEQATNVAAKWSASRKIKGYSKITDGIKAKLDIWIREHPNVRPSPITRDTLLVETRSRERKNELASCCSRSPFTNYIMICFVQ
jgi:hypothetical protein